MSLVRQIIRSLVAHPGFTTLAVLTLALGIGANTAIFSVVYGVVFKPLPLKDADRLVLLFNSYPKANLLDASTSPPDFYDYRKQKHIFAEVATMDIDDYNLSGWGKPDRVAGATISAGGLEMFGVQPIAGRLITEADDQDGAIGVVLLDAGFWKRRFGGDLQILGKTVRLNEQQYAVVGIVPEALGFLARCEIYLPHRFTAAAKNPQRRGRQYLTTIARLKDGLTLEAAGREVAAFSEQLARQNPNAYPPDSGWHIRMVPVLDMLIQEVKPALIALFSAVGLVLLIACANVANLIVTRNASRTRELTVRAALGATRKDLAVQMLAESLAIGVIGGVTGLLLGGILTRLLVSQLPAKLPRLQEIGMNPAVLGFTFLLALATSVLFGLAPVLRVFQHDLQDALRSSTRTASGSLAHHKFRSSLVVAEVSLSLLLVVTAGLLLRTFQKLQAIPLGFESKNVASFLVRLPALKYDSPEKTTTFVRSATELLASLPGVQAVGATHSLPFSGSNSSSSFDIEGRVTPANQSSPHGDIRMVTPGYFAAMTIGLKAGRLFQPTDRLGSREVAIVDDRLARQFWGDESPIGKRIRNGDNDTWKEIVGVVTHVKHSNVLSDGRGAYYFPAYQQVARQYSFAVKAGYETALTLPSVQQVISKLDPDLPVFNFSTMNARVRDSLLAQRLAMYLIGLFSILAMILAAIGLYGVISQLTQQRTQEIGIRMALGADRAKVLRLVLRQAVLLTAIGLVLGTAGVAAIAGMLKRILYGISATDPISMICGAIVLASVALVAALLPAWRAAKVDPLVALRYE